MTIFVRAATQFSLLFTEKTTCLCRKNEGISSESPKAYERAFKQYDVIS